MLQPKEMTNIGNSYANTGIMEYETLVEPMDTGIQEADSQIFDCTNFSNFPLKQTIQTHCLVSDLKKTKILVLICYNENDAFGKVIYDWLNNSTPIKKLLSSSVFIVSRYNITSETIRDNLTISLHEEVKDQHDILCSVQSGKSKIYLLVPYSDIIVSHGYIDESMTTDEAVGILSYTMEMFNDIKKLQLQEEKKNDAALTCELFQQLMMCRLRDRSFDIFFADEHQYLKDKIGFAYFGAPVNTDGTYSPRQNKTIENAYKTIISQSDTHAMDDGVVVISFIYICCLNFKKQLLTETKKEISSVNKEEFKPLPCFVLRKCYNEDKPSESYCRTVIDSTLRVYQSWDKFLHENTYPICVLCVPKDGLYDCDDNGDVVLEYYYAPSCKISQTALRAIDTTSTVAAVGSGSLLLLAAIPAVVIAPVAIIGALVVGAGAGLYSIGRSIHRLVDKSLHHENLSPTEPEARAAYIGIVAGALGFAGAGANVIIANLATSGVQIGKGAILTVDAISKANLAAGGIALTNSVCDVAHSYIIKKETPSRLMFVQLGASVLFFTNSVYQYKNTTEILAVAQKNNAIQEYNNSLKTRKDSSRMGILAALRKAPNEVDTLALILENLEQFSECGINYADGNVLYNGQIMNIAQFTQAINIIDVTAIAPVKNTPRSSSLNITFSDLHSLALKVIPASSNVKDIEVCVLNVLQLFAPAVQRKLLDLIGQIFASDMCRPVSSYCSKLNNQLRIDLQNRGINVEVITQIINCLVSKAETSLNVDLGTSRGIRYVQVLIINSYLCRRSITAHLVQDCIDLLNAFVAKKVVNYIKGCETEERIQTIKRRKRVACADCTGFHHVKK